MLRRITAAAEFYTKASWVLRVDLAYVILLAPKNLRFPFGFWKICAPSRDEATGLVKCREMLD